LYYYIIITIVFIHAGRDSTRERTAVASQSCFVAVASGKEREENKKKKEKKSKRNKTPPPRTTHTHAADLSTGPVQWRVIRSNSSTYFKTPPTGLFIYNVYIYKYVYTEGRFIVIFIRYFSFRRSVVRSYNIVL